MKHTQTSRRSLLYRFAVMFSLFALLSLVISGFLTYVNQSRSQIRESEDNLRNMTGYVNAMMVSAGSDFVELRAYFEQNYDKLRIPIDFDGDVKPAYDRFSKLFAEAFPGKIYGVDVPFANLPDEIALAYAEYRFEYWQNMFEQARDSFGLDYTYFIYPTKDDYMRYMIEGAREPREIDGKTYIMLGDEVMEDPAQFQWMWEAWNTGKEPEGFDIVDNEYGHTYTYYSPLVIDGEKLGLICADLSVANVTNEILYAVARQFGGVCLVLIPGIFIMLSVIRKQFLDRIIRLENSVVTYSADKDASIVDTIRKEEQGDDEIRSLSDEFANMIVELKEYMINLQHVTAEKERIGAELNVATQIQADMLPTIFPPFPEKKEFDLFASMDPAKEVGGDFYDLFLVDDDHLALVMADVSGKGVPAALFMVIAKTLIKNAAQMGYSPSKVLSYANDQLCEGNKAELFVTVWFAVIELSTGKGVAANAGHEHPVLRHAGGEYELVVYRHSPAVATMEGLPFREHEFKLEPGDSLFVYTDGVPEATNASDELFGTDRMLAALNRDPDALPTQLLVNVRKEVDAFVGDAPQFDDLTMMGFTYYGKDGRGTH